MHNLYSWNNGAPTNSLIKPIIDLQTIGIKIYKIDVADISNNTQRILDLSGDVTNLINEPSGIWSDVDSNNIIRLTTARDYGKRLDVSGVDVSNNLIVKGNVAVGYGGTTDISGTLRYTDLSKVEVFYDGEWNKLTGSSNDNLISILLRYNGKKKTKIKLINFVKGEMLKTHGSNLKLKKFIGNFKFTDLNTGIKHTIKNFKKYGC